MGRSEAYEWNGKERLVNAVPQPIRIRAGKKIQQGDDMATLSGTELEKAVATLSGWKLESGELVQEWKFPDFLGAMRFVNQVATLAEEAGHHPDIDIRYNRVRLGLVSHDAGGITERDLSMAKRILAIPAP
jgi:4a-hydroxytetrahydrobiopterin dehydratase